MPITVKHGGATPLLGAYVAGQGQHRQQDEQQALEQAKLLQQVNQFNQELALRKRQVGNQEEEAKFGRQFNVEQLRQRERLAALQAANRAAAQDRDNAARFRLQQMGQAGDVAKLGMQQGFQAQQGALDFERRAQLQQADSGRMRDANIFRANVAAMEAEANALLKHQFPDEQKFQEVWGQYNRKRQMLGLEPMDPPPYQQPPPSQKELQFQQLQKIHGEDAAAFIWNEKESKWELPSGMRYSDLPGAQKRQQEYDTAMKNVESGNRIKESLAVLEWKQKNAPEEDPELERELDFNEKRTTGKTSFVQKMLEIEIKRYESEEDLPGAAPRDPLDIESLVEKYGNLYDKISGVEAEQQPEGSTLPKDGSVQEALMPGTAAHSRKMFDMKQKGSPADVLAQARKLPIIVDEATWEHMPPGDYMVKVKGVPFPVYQRKYKQ